MATQASERATGRRLRGTAAWPVTFGMLGVVLVFQFQDLWSVVDDAYIGFRYLDQWLGGQGLVFNPGERVEGYTNFGWVVLLAPLRVLGPEPEWIAWGLSAVGLTAIFWAVWHTASDLSGEREAGHAALLLALGSAGLARWASSGMETVFFAALLALANQRLARRGRHSLASSVFFGLAVLTRPEGLLHAGMAFVVALGWPPRSTSWRGLVAPFGALAVFPALHTIFRLTYYGAALPNTAYAKLGGAGVSLVPGGLAYLGDFLLSGGAFLVLPAFLILATPKGCGWVGAALGAQIVAQMLYVVWIGGDYFSHHRFLVPAVPALAVLGGAGLVSAASSVAPSRRVGLPLLAATLAVLEAVSAYTSADRGRLATIVENNAERERVATWIEARFPADALLAVNAAGRIPYRTGMRAIDMLGLNDAHIARARSTSALGGSTFVGHFKHDGAYVCRRAPDVVLTSGGRLFRGRNADEAIAQAALNTFPGDREFLDAAGCRDRYEPVAEELLPGRFVVVFVRARDGASSDTPAVEPGSAEGWFRRGLTLMKSARLREAIRAFERSLALAPDHPRALTNLAYCWHDLGEHRRALQIFENVVARFPQAHEALYGLALTHRSLGQREQAIALWQRYLAIAPESPWSERARRQLRDLGARPP